MENIDWDDIQACLNGNNEAYRSLVQRHEAQITKLMWRFTRNRSECEKLVEDVFVEAYFSLKNYKGNAPFIHWLKKIGTRTGYKFWKKQKKENLFLPLQDFDQLKECSDESVDPSIAAEILHSLLEQLTISDRMVLTLMYFENCSTEEIAKRIGSTRAAVKMRAMRARKKIKEIAEQNNLFGKLGWTF